MDTSQNKDTTKKVDIKPGTIQDLFFKRRFYLFSQISLISISVIGLFCLIGFFLDTLLGTKPIIIIGSLVISFPITQIILYKRMKFLAQIHKKD